MLICYNHFRNNTLFLYPLERQLSALHNIHCMRRNTTNMKITHLVNVEVPMSKPLIIIRENPVDIGREMLRFTNEHNNSATPREKAEFSSISWILKFAACHGFVLHDMRTNLENQTLMLTFAFNTLNDVSFFKAYVTKEIICRIN